MMAWLPVAFFFAALGLLLANVAFPRLDAVVYAMLGVGLAAAGASMSRGKPPAVRRAGFIGLLLCGAGLGGFAYLQAG
ncbi:MAG: hypothetical protein AABZ30_01555 [Myxococcota bacterium]